MALCADISFNTWLSIASTLFAAIAAVATVIAVAFARKTVTESETATQTAADQHREQLQAMNMATESQVNELRRATAASKVQHEIEMEDRARATQTAEGNRQIAQLQRVADLLVDYADTAKSELIKPAPVFTLESDGTSLRVSSTRLPAIYSRLKLEMTALRMYGGIDLTSGLTEPSRFDIATVRRCWNEAQQLIATVADIAQDAAVAADKQVAAELAARQKTPPE